MNNRYGFGRTVALPFDTAVERVTAALGAEGFGILTEIDVQATLKKKLDLDRPRQKILGACNPSFAAKALDAEPAIGLLLPCNVVVRADGPDAVLVQALDPQVMVSVTGRADDQIAEGDVETVLGSPVEASASPGRSGSNG